MMARGTVRCIPDAYSPRCLKREVFSEVRLVRRSLRFRPVLVWWPEVGELGEEVIVWSHLVLRHPPVRQDGDQVIAHVVGEQATVVRVANRLRRVVGQDIR